VHNFNYSPNTFRKIKPIRKRWITNAAHMLEIRNAYTIWPETLKGKGHLGGTDVEEKIILSYYNRITRDLREKGRDSSVGIATGYELDCRGSIPGRGKRFFSPPQRPDRLWGPPSLLPNGYRGLVPRDKEAWA
jgi:hypothetical protein